MTEKPKVPMMKEAGALLKKYRTEKGLSASKLGKLAGLAATSIIRIEEGDFSPGVESARSILTALDVSPRHFLYFASIWSQVARQKVAEWDNLKSRNAPVPPIDAPFGHDRESSAPSEES